MKKTLKAVRMLLAFIFVLIVLYLGYQYKYLRLYVKSENISIPKLTARQKEEDFKFLTSYVRDCYPYGSAVEKHKGLDNILSLEEQYIKRAGNTKNNLEFLELFIEYSQRLGQAGHWGIQWLGTENYSLGYSYMFGIPKDAFNKTDYWLKLSASLPLYVHTDMKFMYSGGKYILSEDYVLDDVIIPKNTVIEMVNGMKVDEYVKSLQSKQVLRFDDIKNKVCTENLFINNPGENIDGWEVEFVFPDSNRYTGEIKKINGYKNPNIAKSSTGSNVICKELDEQTGYIKIFTFFQEFIESDNIAIQGFMKSSGGKYKKLIIDVRGNSGGEPVSWMENLMQPLLKETVSYDCVTAVKKSYFSRMNLRYPYYRLTTSNHLLDREINHISKIDKINYEGLDDSEWTVYKITRALSPQNSFPFDGQVYVIADNDTLSAADSFVSAVRATKLGKVVGTNTLGWGNVFMQPNMCAMPNSGLMLWMDVEMPYNCDGTVTSIYGTKPDVNLSPSTYPTPYPADFEKNTLLMDPWIIWAMNDSYK